MKSNMYFDGVEFIRKSPERRFESFTAYKHDESQDWYCNKCEQVFYEGNGDPARCAYCGSNNIEIM